MLRIRSLKGDYDFSNGPVRCSVEDLRFFKKMRRGYSSKKMGLIKLMEVEAGQSLVFREKIFRWKFFRGGNEKIFLAFIQMNEESSFQQSYTVIAYNKNYFELINTT